MSVRSGESIEVLRLEQLAWELAEIGRAVRDELLGSGVPMSGEVLRREGGDEIFGVDELAHSIIIRGLEQIAPRWPGSLIIEGSDTPIEVGRQRGSWVFLVDPIDGTRPWLADKRSAWVLLGAGRRAHTLEDLEVGAAVEIPTQRARLARVAWAVRGGVVHAVDDDMRRAEAALSVELHPSEVHNLARSFVTIVRFSPGNKAAIGRWEDQLLAGTETYEDPYMCTGGQLMGLASGTDVAILDPRPYFDSVLSAHPYDLASIVVARQAGVIVESLAGTPFTEGLAPDTPMAWAGYANRTVRAILRERIETVGFGINGRHQE